MKVSFAIALLSTVLFSVGYWYQSTATICPVPLSYRIGELNPAFELSFDEARERVVKAEHQWEEAVNRELFVYDEQAEFTVNFIFDERQQESNAEERQRRFLDGQLAENEELFAAIEFAQQEYDSLSRRYETRVSEYEARLSTYNQTVQKFNDRGGAPEAEFQALEEERMALEREATALEAMIDDINQLATRINRLSEEGNRLINAYNQDVELYNQNFGFAREFTQGDFQSDRINIYEFSSDNELQTVLLHEFGHALGIGHVAASSSVMYYLLEDVERIPVFSASDLQAFYEICETGKEWDHQLRKAIRNTLSMF
jgi:predicted Zn-dependent protease